MTLFLFIVSSRVLFAADAKVGQFVTATVAQVGPQVITSREVVIGGIIDKWLLVKSAEVDKSSWVVKPGSDEFQRQLTQIMLETIVWLEAENFSVGVQALDEAKKLSLQIKEDLKNWDDWKKLEVTTSEIELQLARNLRAKSFLKFKTESIGTLVSDEEAKEYFEKNRLRFGSFGFEKFKDSIKEFLGKQKLEDKLKDWFEILKRKYKVRFLTVPSADL